MSEEVKKRALCLQQQLQRDVNCLSDSNRSVRTTSLSKIRKCVFVEEQLSSEEMLLLLDFLLKPLLKLFPDQVEKCRETSLAIFREFYERLNCEGIERSLTYLMPVIVSRLANQDIIEPSEEIRLQMMQFLEYFLKILSKQVVTPFYEDIILILQFTVKDPYAEVKKVSCSLVEYIAPLLKDQFYVTGERLLAPLISSVGHQHSKVRVATLRALGVTMQFGGNSAGKRLEECMFPLAQRTFDQIPAVRLCLYQILGGWLLELLDRYSYWYRLLPVFLSGLSDELAEVRQQVSCLYEEIGARYEQENEAQLKDLLDYPATTSIDTPYARPRLGCRVLVRENFSRILPALIRDMTDWTERNRLKAAELLHTLLIHEEDHATQHTPAILQGFYKGMLVEELSVKERIDASAEVVGYFVSPDTWLPLVTSAVIGSTGVKIQSPVPTSVHSMVATLRVFSHLLKGAKAPTIECHIPEIVQCLTTPDFVLSETHDVILHLVSCIHGFIDKTNREDCEAISAQLFSCLLGMSAKSKLAKLLRDSITDTQHALATRQDMRVEDLYRVHTESLLQLIAPTSANWLASSSHEFLVFISVLTHAGTHLGSLLALITNILVACMAPKKDNVIKLEIFNVLVLLLTSDPGASLDSQGQLREFIPDWLHKLILPNCSWSLGRSSGVMRTATVSCLWALAKTGSFPSQLCSDPSLLAAIPTLLGDEHESARLATCKAFKEIVSVPGIHLSTDQLHELYPHLIKRLDDNRDDVRVATCKILARYFQLFPSDYDRDRYSVHFKDIYQGLLLHLDDPLQEIQEEVYAVLLTAAKVCPELLIEQLDSVRHKHRVSHYCEKLSEHVMSLVD